MSARTPFLVGLVLIMAAAGLSYFVMNTSKDKFDDASTYPLTADFTDASGIRGKTRVQINGIDVGKIADISHARSANGRLVARVTLRIGNAYEIYENALVSKQAESLLGDFRLDLDPGTSDARKLAHGEAIRNVHSLSDIDEIKSQLLQVSRNVNEVTHSFQKVLAGPEGEGSLKSILNKVESSMSSIENTTRALERTIAGNDQVISEIIHNVGRVSESIATISKPGGDLFTISHNFAALSAKLDKLADGLNSIVSPTPDADGNLPPGDAKSVRSTLENLNESLVHLNAIARKIDEGQGTVGRVVNDSAIADKVEATLDSANQIIGSISGLQTTIELRSEYGVPFVGTNSQVQPSIKNTLGLRIQPKPDKYYLLEAVADPRGYQTRTLSTTTVGGNNPVVSDQSVIAFNSLKFSAEFAKRYYFLTMRFGIIESTGGLGLDLHAYNDRAEIRLDAFDFTRRDPGQVTAIFPRVRARGIYEVANHVHVQLGIDDPFTNLRTWFLGGILRFTDDDLKGMLTIAPRP